MQIDKSTIDNAAVLALNGDLDSFSVSNLKERFNRLFDEGVYNIVVDLSNVGFMDSAGLGQLVSGLKMCFHHSGNLMLVGANESIKNLLQITKLDTVFRVYETVDEAVAGLPN